MRSRWNLPIFAAYAAGSLAVLSYLALQMGGEFLLQPSYQVRAVFSTGSQLVSGDDVTISGLRVGQLVATGGAGKGAGSGGQRLCFFGSSWRKPRPNQPLAGSRWKR